MKFEEVLPALREGKKISLKGCEVFKYLFKPKNENELKTEDYHNIQLSWEDLFRDDWEIVKETKKVKLRDLTEEQYEKWFNNNCCTKNKDKSITDCFKCVIHNAICNPVVSRCWTKHKDLYSDKFLDQEIEIEVEE